MECAMFITVNSELRHPASNDRTFTLYNLFG